MDPPYRRNRRSQRRSSSPESNSAPNRASTSPSRRFRRSPSARPQYRFEAHHQGAEHSPLVASLLNNSRPLSRDDFDEWTNRFRNAVSLASPSPPRRARAEYRNWLPRDQASPSPSATPNSLWAPSHHGRYSSRRRDHVERTSRLIFCAILVVKEDNPNGNADQLWLAFVQKLTSTPLFDSEELVLQAWDYVFEAPARSQFRIFVEGTAQAVFNRIFAFALPTSQQV